jgi:DNA (cytosine-5)-methyltransferase 1
MSLSEVEEITSLLSREYGDPGLQNQRDPLDELVFILLSEKTDEAKYVTAFLRLKAKFGKLENALHAPDDDILCQIAEAGMGSRRVRLLRSLLEAVRARFGSFDLTPLSAIPPDEAEKILVELPGIGHKAARCVLLYCFDREVLPVDVHTYRLAVRLGMLSRRTSYEKSHTVLSDVFPQHLRRAFHTNAVAHGRTRCFSLKPRCEECPLAAHCMWPHAVAPVPVQLRPSPIAVDLFAGAGGLSLGFENAGFAVVQAVESGQHAAATYRHNHPRADVLQADIAGLDPKACLRRLGLREGDVTVLIGGPPCQGFSESNRRTRTLENPRNHLYSQVIRFIEAIEPEWFVMENVAGLRTLAGGKLLRRILGECEATGYQVAVAELNAADFGVPQFRRRLFIVGHRGSLCFEPPKPTHGCEGRPYITVRDAISDLPTLEVGASADWLVYQAAPNKLTEYQKQMRGSTSGLARVQGNLVSRNNDLVIQRYNHIKPGQNWTAIPNHLLRNYSDPSRCHTGIYHRLLWDSPAKVIGNFRKNMLIHPEQHRGLSVREAARLQSFPDRYVFVGSIGFQQQQVADAVPPVLAEVVARCLARRIRLARDCR